MILGRISEQINEECHKQERRYCTCSFLYPCHKMAEGHIELTLSVCVCIPDSCATHNVILLGGI